MRITSWLTTRGCSLQVDEKHGVAIRPPQSQHQPPQAIAPAGPPKPDWGFDDVDDEEDEY